MSNLDIFLKRDIKAMIETSCQSVGYIRGYMTACYHLNQITKEVYLELKKCLAENFNNIIKKKGDMNVVR